MKEEPEMKNRFLIIPAFIAALILGGCASSGYITDDVYYIPQDNAFLQAGTTVKTNTETTAQQPAEASGDEVFTAIDDYYRDNTYNEDTLQLSQQEANANQGGNVIINNYDGSYAARINHFFYPSMGFGYYDPFFYGGRFYDPFYSPGLSFSMGYGFGYGYGYGLGLGLGYGYPFYNSWYNPFYLYSPYSYYPYYGGYYGYTGVYLMPYKDYETYNPKYGHRNTVVSNRLYSPRSGASASPAKSSFIPSDSRRVSGSRRATGTSAAATQPRTTSGMATTRTRGTGTTVTTGKKTMTRTTYQPRRTSQGTTHVRTTRLPQSTTNRTTTIQHRTTTTTRSTGRTYVPRYTNTKATRTTTRPSYNPSSYNIGTSRSKSVTSSPVRKSYSTPVVKRSSSSYIPRRSYTPTHSSYNRSSFSSSSISAPRTSSTSSRSSESGGRRR